MAAAAAADLSGKIHPSSSSCSGVGQRDVLLLVRSRWQEHWWRQPGRHCACYVHQALVVWGYALCVVAFTMQCRASSGCSSSLVVSHHRVVLGSCGRHDGLDSSS